MTVKITAFSMEGEPYDFTLQSSGKRVQGDAWGSEPVVQDVTLSADGGRVAAFTEALTNPSAGRAVARTDGGSTLDLSNVKTAQVVTADLPGGGTATINVAAMVSRDGWAPADYYMLEADPATGNLIVEPGRGYIRIYITASAAAYDEAKIAAEFGNGLTAAGVTGAWLLDHPEYGATTGKAVTVAVAGKITAAMARTQKVVPTPHRIYERGYNYPITHGGGPNGESPLHPCLWDAWGTGADPTGITFGQSNGFFPSNHVFKFAVHPAYRNHFNLIYADFVYNGLGKGDFLSYQGEWGDGLTFYRTMIHSVTKAAPANGTTWDDSNDRVSGMYVAYTKGILIEKSILWHNGWGDGFGQNREGNLPQPPSALSHNIYFQYDNFDTTIRNTASLQGSSTSWQFRSGGWLLNNIQIDDNIMGSGGGATAATDDHRGQWTVAYRQIGTSAGYKDYNRQRPGALQWGMDLFAPKIPVVDCWMFHMRNPDDPAEIAAKPTKVYDYNAVLLNGTSPLFNSGSYGWSNANRNIEGLDTSVLDTTTIQRFAAAKRGQATSIPQLAQYLTTLSAKDRWEFVSDSIEYFLTPVSSKLLVGVSDPYQPRATPAHHVFEPSPTGEGYRWDYPLNWKTKQLPGQNDLDTADLNGNTVKFLIDTKKLDSLTFDGGLLKVSSGVLRVTNHTDAANVLVHNCGQYYAPAGTGDYELRNSGRLVFTGASTVGIKASGQSELCLGRDVTIPAGKSLRIGGDMGWAGWDWTDGTAVLNVDGDLEFEVTPVIKMGGYGINAMVTYKGQALGRTSGFTGDIDSWRFVGLESFVRIRNASGTPQVGENIFDTGVLPKQASSLKPISALAAAEIGKLQRFRSGRFGLTEPGATVTVNLSGEVKIIGRQYLVPGQTYDLGGGAGTGVTYVNDGATLPAGVTLVSGKLTLTI